MGNLLFKVVGPFEVPVEKRRQSRMIQPGCPEFWTKHATYADKRGCYVFAVRASRGYRPIYIGKTKKSFKQECFTDHKVGRHYNPAMLDTKKGTPVMFFLIAPSTKGKFNERILSDLESFLIQVGASRNSGLSNVKGRKEKAWGIAGVIRGGKGKPNESAKKFKHLMGI